MDIFEVIRGRRTIRSYEDRPVEQEKLAAVLDACRWAPSAGNRQPWEIIVVDNQDTKDRLAQAALEQNWMKTAPVILAVCMNENIAKGTYGERGPLYGLETMGMAIENMMLAAYAVGLGSCCVTAFEEGKVKEILKCLEIIKPVALLTLGYPREEPRVPHRDDISGFTYHNSYMKHNTPEWPGLKKTLERKFKKGLKETLEEC